MRKLLLLSFLAAVFCYASVSFAQIPSWAANCPRVTLNSGNCGCAPDCVTRFPLFNCTLPANVSSAVRRLFPEGSSPDSSLLGNLAPIKIRFNQRSNINFTFVSEGAGYRNQFGYFFYNESTRTPFNFTMVFPDVSNPSTGGTGCLRPGFTAAAGQVPAGVDLGFWVVADGYNSGTDRWVSFTDGNLLTNVDNKNHTGFVFLSELNTTLFGFEDLNGLGDQDYNDCMFTFATDGQIDLSQIPRFEGGRILTCRVGVIASQDYLEYNCQQWALMSVPSGALCNSYLTPPNGWTFATNTSETLEMLRAVGRGTFSRTLTGFDESGNSVNTGCAVVRLTNSSSTATSYNADGSLCDQIEEPQFVMFPNSPNCFSTQCNNRILIRGGTVSSCTISTNEYCDPAVSARLVNRVPSNIPTPDSPAYASTQHYPTAANFFLTQGNSINFNVSVILKSALQGGVASDIYILFDMMNAYDKDKEYMRDGIIPFYNEITNPNTIGFDLPNIGFGTFRESGGVPSFSNDCPLSPDVTRIKNCIDEVSFSRTTTTAQNVAGATQLAMSALLGQFRSFAYKIIIVITDSATATSSITALRDTQLRTNIVPLIFNPNPTTSGSSSVTANYEAIVRGIYHTRRYVGPNRANNNLRGDRLKDWASLAPPEVKRMVQNITLARMAPTTDNTIPNAFLQSIAAPLDTSSSAPATFNRPVTIGWSNGLSVSTFPVRSTVTIMGFGRVDLTISTNRAPTAPDNSPVTTDEDTPVNFAISASDIDNNLMRIRFTAQTNAALGTLFLGGGGSAVALNTLYNNTFNFRYVPAADQSGIATYTYVVTDGCLTTPPRTLTIEVRAVNDPPVARDFTVFVDENDVSLANIASIVFNSTTITDIDTPFNNLLISVVTVPSTTLGDLADGATVIRNTYNLGTRRSLTFTPAAYKSGTTSFIYRVSDGSLTSDAVVTIVVVDKRWPPVLSVTPNPVTTNAGNTTTITVTVIDPDALESVYNERTTLFASTVELLTANNMTISNGVRTIAAGAADGAWTSAVAYASPNSIRTFQITWNADTAAVVQNITLRATDAQGLNSNSVILQLIVSGNRPPRIVFHPATLTVAEDAVLGPFTLQGTDDDAPDEWRFLSITFNALPSNGVLRIISNTNKRSVEDTEQSGAVFDVTAASRTFFVQRGQNPTLSTSFYSVTYTPNPNFNGQDMFTYTVADQRLGVSLPETTVITVTPVNDRPTTSSFTVTLDSWYLPSSPVSADVTEFSAFDIDSTDILSLEVLSLPALGTLKRNGVALTSSNLPLNVGVKANWAFTYEPPYLGSSNPDGSEYANFNFRICDNSNAANNCSDTAKVSLIVNFVNTPPLSNDFDVYTDENVPVSFVFPARDPDLPRHNDTVLYAVVTSLGVRNKGELFLCSEMIPECLLNNSRVNEAIRFPRRVWYKPAVDDYSTPEAPSATLRFQVGDETLNTAFTYTVNVFVNFINDPPEWKADSIYNIDEDTTFNLFTLDPSNWDDDLLRVPINQNNPPFPVVSVSVLSIPSRGALFTCNASACTELTSANLPAIPGDSLGRILFRPLANEFGANYASFVFNLKDSGFPFGPSRSINVTITINVLPVNDAPIIKTQFPTVAQGGDGPIINEDSFVDLAWRLTDIDTLPDQLVTRVRASLFTRSGWTVFNCTDDGFDGCSPSALITNNIDSFRSPIMRFSVATSSCNLVQGRPITDFENCYAEFLIRFIPEPNRYQIPFIQLAFVGFDQQDEGEPALTVISVLPVNDPPTILAPATISPTAGVAEMDILDDIVRPPVDFPFPVRSDTEKTNGVFVWDSDANPAGAIERLTVEVTAGDGTFLPHPSLNCNQTSDFFWQCDTTINVMNKRLKESKFRVNTEFGATDATVVWTINDLGNTSPEDRVVPLSANATTRFIFTRLPEIGAVPPPNNNLTLAAGIAAAAGLILIALLAWRLRKAFAAPDDQYFEVATSAISVAPTNPLFKPQFQDHNNPLYAPGAAN